MLEGELPSQVVQYWNSYAIPDSNAGVVHPIQGLPYGFFGDNYLKLCEFWYGVSTGWRMGSQAISRCTYSIT